MDLRPQFYVGYDENLYQWLNVKKLTRQEFMDFLQENNYGRLLELLYHQSRCTCYISMSSRIILPYFKCSCEKKFRISIFIELFENETNMIADFVKSNFNELNSIEIDNLMASAIILSSKIRNMNYKVNIDVEILSRIYHKAQKNENFMFYLSKYLAQMPNNYNITFIKSVNESDANIEILLSDATISIEIMSFIIDNTTIDVMGLFNTNYGMLYITDIRIYEKILSKYNINQFPYKFWRNVSPDTFLALYDRGYVNKVIDKELIAELITSRGTYRIFQEYVIQWLQNFDVDNSIVTKIFNKLLTTCYYFTLEESLNTVNYMIENYDIVFDSKNIENFVTRFLSRNLHDPNITKQFLDILRFMVSNTVHSVESIISEVQFINFAALDILITYGRIDITYDFIQKNSHANIIYDITRFGLEYGEELYRVFFLQNKIVLEYHEKSTFIPSEFKNLWLAVSSIGLPRMFKKLSISKKVLLKFSNINKGDECKPLKKEVQNYLLQSSHMLGYFLQLVYIKMPRTFNEIKSLYQDFIPQELGCMNCDLLKEVYAKRT